MNVLFFLEPAIEFGNPLFRFATLRNSILPQIKTLVSAGHTVVTVLSTPVASKGIEEFHNQEKGIWAVIDPIEWMAGESYLSRSQRHIKEQYHEGEINRISVMLNSALPEGFSPDITITWESPTKYIKNIFPRSKILYQMPGFFSRPPFANLISIDSEILENTLPPKNNECLEENKNALQNLRNKEIQFLSSVSPTSKLVEEVRKDFKKIFLLPLQIDNYFMINSVISGSKTQFDILVDLLSELPKEYALLVTNYKSKDTQSEVLTDAGIDYLRKRFPNFVYRKETDVIPWVSQFLTPLVDAVITVSSSIGYQAAFWKKPLLTLGKSHLSNFATSSTLAELIIQVEAQTIIEQDELILNTLRHKHVSMEFIQSPGYARWLQAYTERNVFNEWSSIPVAEELISLRRESNLLEALGFFNAIRGESSIDHCNELSNQIIKHEVISFDVFDTLLYRPFKSPSDLYKLIEDEARIITEIPSLDFKSKRREAEKLAFQAAIERGDGEITIHEIYQTLASIINIDSDRLEKLMLAEMNAEKELLYPRTSGYKAFLEAKSLNKRIIIISDMYLPESFIRELLDKNGYSGYERIFVSSTYKVKKHSGALFDVVLNELNVSPNSILHVGDNIDADVKKAKSRGIKPFHLIKASDVFSSNTNFKTPWARDESRHSLDWSMILAVIGNKLHDNPYLPHRANTLFGGSPIKLGYYGFGPLLLGYTKWLIENSIKDGVEKLYFLSRDGKIMKVAYDIISSLYPNAPKSEYLLCSRRAVNLAKVQSLADIIDLLHVDFAHRVSLDHLLKYRFGVSISDISPEVLALHGYSYTSKLTRDDIPTLENLFSEIKDILLISAESERVNYLEYLNNSEIFSDRKTAIVDIGYAGTMQESLYKLSESKNKIGGYYLITFRQALKRVSKNHLPIRGYLAEFIDRHDTYHNFCRHVPLYETLFSSTDTSFVRIAKDWDGNLYPVFMSRSPIEEKRENVVNQVHSGAVDFITQIHQILGTRLTQLDIEPNKSLRVLDSYFTNPHPRDALILSGVMFEDAYGGTSYKTILPLSTNLKSNCVWKNGADVLMQTSKEEPNPSQPLRKKIQSKSLEKNSYQLQTSAKLINSIIALTLPKKKKLKLNNKPHLFFSDAKNPLIKKIGSFYLKRITNI
jgi:HAD superfamily hydrolase (TIGR01549 family)